MGAEKTSLQRGFKGVWIPRNIWELPSDELSWIEKLFLCEIDSLDLEDGCFATNSYFAKFFQKSNSRVSHIISTLKAKKYINITIIKGENGNVVKRIIKISKLYRIKQSGITTIEETEEPQIEEISPNLTTDKGNEVEALIIEPSDKNMDIVKSVISDLNDKSGFKYNYKIKATSTLILSRLKDGHTLEDFLKVNILKKWEWGDSEKMRVYLRPSTLYRKSNFDNYLAQNISASELEAKLVGKFGMNFNEADEIINEAKKYGIVV